MNSEDHHYTLIQNDYRMFLNVNVHNVLQKCSIYERSGEIHLIPKSNAIYILNINMYVMMLKLTTPRLLQEYLRGQDVKSYENVKY